MIDTILLVLRYGALVWAIVGLAALIATVLCAIARGPLAARRHRSTAREPVSVVIPIKMLDEGFDEAQTSVLRNSDVGEIVVTAREAESPAVEAAQRLYLDVPVPVRILRSTASFAASPKVDNLVEAIEVARHDVIFMKDSNVEITDDGVASALAALEPDVGLVCAIPRAIATEGFAAAIEAQVMNQSHGRLLLTADAFGLGFGVGKIMVFRRSNLSRIGGLAAVAHSVGEDSALAHAFEKAGLRTVFMRPPVNQRLGRRGWRDVFDRQFRWTSIRAHHARAAFVFEPLGLSVCAALAAALAAPLAGLSPLVAAVGCLAIWFACETVLAFVEGWDVSISAPAVMVARDAMMLTVWLRAWVSDEVVWADQAMPVIRDDTRPPEANDREKV